MNEKELAERLRLAREVLQDCLDMLEQERPAPRPRPRLVDPEERDEAGAKAAEGFYEYEDTLSTFGPAFKCKSPEDDWVAEQKRRWDTVTHRQERDDEW